MDFLFHVPFFCTAAAAAVTEILAVCLGRSFLHQLSSHLESHLNCYFFTSNVTFFKCDLSLIGGLLQQMEYFTVARNTLLYQLKPLFH
jgi:hypothetical protein